jgi:streptomycin 6-kinase
VIAVPRAFADERIRLSGEPGRRWVEGLPALVADLCGRWRLEPTAEPPMHGALGVVFPVRRDGEDLVLKVGWQERTTVDEAAALRAWNGDGAVRLLDDDGAGALLLERLDSRRSLRDLPLLAAAEIAGGLIRRLAIPAPEGIRSLDAVAEGIAEDVHLRNERLGRPVPLPWADLVAGLARDLGADAGSVLVHGDLHYGNVLAGRRTWLAVDPKAVSGDPECSVPELMWTRLDEAAGPAGARTLLDTVVGAAGLDPAKARGWTIIRAVDYWLWGLDAGLTEDPVRCRRLVETFTAA